MVQRKAQSRPVNKVEDAHHRIRLLGVKSPAQKQRAEHRHQGHGDYRRARDGKSLGEGERMKQLPFFAGERKHGNERENDDRHRKEDRAPDESRGLQHCLPHQSAVVGIDLSQLDKAKSIFRNHNAGIDQHPYGNGNTRKRHQV